MKTPTISTIIPVYNVKDYVSLAIQSVIDQDIGFSENIELILVNDGSTDDSAEICRDFLRRYPNNIQYIEQSNQGVSVARNRGLQQARGKYVNFFDADDVWQQDAYRKMVAFLDTNKEVDFVAAKIKFFDRSIDEHPLNYKFIKSRVIDVSTDPDTPIMHIISCIIRREALEGKSFDVRLKVAEDAKLLNEILAIKKCYGVVTTTQYNYRKRGNSSSAIDGGQQKKEYYLETPLLAYESMCDDWRMNGTINTKILSVIVVVVSTAWVTPK